MTIQRIKAVMFDIGGVVMQSPFVGIAQFERDHGIPQNYLNCSIVGRGSQGAWQKFERGELRLFSFYQAISREISDTVFGNAEFQTYCKRKGLECPALPETLAVDGRELFSAMMRNSRTHDPYIEKAIRSIRAAGKHKIIALTNNFDRKSIPEEEKAFLALDKETLPRHLRKLFDDICDSSVLGKRKPDPAFYILACERNGVQPEEVVFLDDIGMNLKPAKVLGMTTIHVSVGRTLEAVKTLGTVLGLDLLRVNGDCQVKL